MSKCHIVGNHVSRLIFILQLEVDPSGPAFDLEVPLEVIIGTIPLRMFIPTFASQYPPPAAPLHPIGGPPPDGAQGGTISPSAPDLRKFKSHMGLFVRKPVFGVFLQSKFQISLLSNRD